VQSDNLLTVKEVARRLNVTTSFVYGQCYGGHFPYCDSVDERYGFRRARCSESRMR